VVRLAVSGVMRASVAGAVIGLGAALWLGRMIEPLLFGVTARDGSTAAGVLTALVIVTVIAAVQPALRAVRVDPATALRHEG
jgi:ABC-type lipoprotein release transport system permease subunit